MTDEEKRERAALEAALSYRIRPDMTREEKIKALADAFWCTHNSGYGDMIAGKLMAGIEDGQTKRYELDCKHQYEIERLLTLLKAEE